VWFKPFGSIANQNENQGVSGYDAKSWGAMLGAEHNLESLGTVGASFGYARSNLDPDNVNSRVRLDTYKYSLYGTKNLMGQADFSWNLGGGVQDNSASRSVDGFGVARADYSSDFIMAGAAISHAFSLDDKNKFIPSIRLDYSEVSDNGYRESGSAGALNLIVNDHETQRLVAGLDGKYVYKPNSDTTFNANLGVGYDTIQDDQDLKARFVGTAGNCCTAQPIVSFNVATMDPSPWLVRGGLGANFSPNKAVDMSARYDVNLREEYYDQTASVKIRFNY
jgi:outer membrane autotransporter protein